MQIRWSFALPPPLASILILRKKTLHFHKFLLINKILTQVEQQTLQKSRKLWTQKLLSTTWTSYIWHFFPKPTHKCNRAVKSVSGSVNSRCTIIMLVECTNSNCSRTFFTLFFFAIVLAKRLLPTQPRSARRIILQLRRKSV